MKKQPVFVADLFTKIIEKVSTNLLTSIKAAQAAVTGVDSTITGVHYLYGHKVDIKKKLQEKSQSQTFTFDKYPLIALFMDFAEDNPGNGKIKVKLQFIIGYHTEVQYDIEDRYKYVFKPILYPIYLDFLNEIAKSLKFTVQNAENIVHTKVDRPLWGKEGTYGTAAYIFSDVLDAIEIKNLDLEVDLSFCNK